jgi:hypothetical protein
MLVCQQIWDIHKKIIFLLSIFLSININYFAALLSEYDIFSG